MSACCVIMSIHVSFHALYRAQSQTFSKGSTGIRYWHAQACKQKTHLQFHKENLPHTKPPFYAYPLSLSPPVSFALALSLFSCLSCSLSSSRLREKINYPKCIWSTGNNCHRRREELRVITCPGNYNLWCWIWAKWGIAFLLPDTVTSGRRPCFRLSGMHAYTLAVCVPHSLKTVALLCFFLFNFFFNLEHFSLNWISNFITCKDEPYLTINVAQQQE